MGEAKRRGTFEERKAEAIKSGFEKMSYYSGKLRKQKRAAKIQRIDILRSLLHGGFRK